MNSLHLLDPLLNDPDIMTIMVDRFDQIYIKHNEEIKSVPSPFTSESHLMEMLQSFAASVGQSLDAQHPALDARLPDGSRLSAVVAPMSINGPTLTINRFSSTQRSRFTIDDVIRFGSLDEKMVRFLQACVAADLNIIVAGGANSGKTTLFELVAGMIPPQERIVMVEEAIMQIPDSTRRLTRLEGCSSCGLQDVLVNAQRLSPDWLVVGEITDGSALLSLCDAMSRGSTAMMVMHSTCTREVLTRLEMSITSCNPMLPVLNTRQLIASALDVIVYQEQMDDGHRRITSIAEVSGMQGNVIQLQNIFEYRDKHTPTGYIPRFLDRIQRAGVDLPVSFFTP